MHQLNEESYSLRLDVECALREAHREQPAIFGRPLSQQELRDLAVMVAEKLRHRIGGRYVPKMADREAREARNAAVLKAFNGNNREQVMREFNISRRLFYCILAEDRKQRLGSRP
ncbi:Mor transcription activator family protein [Aquabacterium sp. G14]|uniref:Mor transcription activator family protein n=1 Tax=Aquabacterium sp. G14 TaxID=3130164 RepID=UPI0030A8F390